jgi:hypothetical protein
MAPQDHLMGSNVANGPRHIRQQVEIFGSQISKARQSIGELGKDKSCLHYASSYTLPILIWSDLDETCINV